MTKTWVAADHHFGHQNICNFLRDDGTKLRPFDKIEEHDEHIIAAHNRLVDPGDRVYLLGDICITRRSCRTLGRLNGRLVLVKGNHDIFNLKDYIPYVDDIRSYVVQKDHDGHKVIMSHIPVHPESLARWGSNIHGHTHYRSVMRPGPEATSDIDPRYVCVSLEHINYEPIEVQAALKRKTTLR